MFLPVTLILPTYNERANIVPLILKIFKTVPHVSILVVDDSSPDGTGKAVAELAQQFPQLSLLSRSRKEGLGKAYLHAFREALKDTAVKKIVTMDADFSHDPSHLPALLEKAKRFDVVVGSRYISGGKTVGWELWRTLLSRFANWYARVITRLPIRDVTSGFSVVDASCLRRTLLETMDTSGYAFTIELKFLLHVAGASFIEVPIVFRNRTGGESKMSGHIIGEGISAPWKMILRRGKF